MKLFEQGKAIGVVIFLSTICVVADRMLAVDAMQFYCQWYWLDVPLGYCGECSVAALMNFDYA